VEPYEKHKRYFSQQQEIYTGQPCLS